MEKTRTPIEVVVQIITQEIQRVKGLGLSQKDLTKFWLSLSEEIPRSDWGKISVPIYKKTNSKVLWINENTVEVDLSYFS